ncbi:MAG: response regulator transcription factor [Zhenhengia sp.]|jgi:two-component system response regulator CssR|uniref:response regulator transcription factor n=1 Tax=Zhenhengia sp. TaxID=2944208 RepID=UPI002907B804|nr:response regulator transcription factor [Clostridiales bacterium]MDU6975981.1 response regulator transcription factor [Clostridiales bacterium]
MITIGIVEDETNLRDIVKGYLEKEGYKVYAFPSAEEARDYLDYEIHLWILDIMLPGQNGFDFMEDVKEKSPQVPVIFISARDQTFDRILGLEKGGEDYVTKPFSTKELMLRVKRILERCYGEDEVVTIADYQIEFNTHKVYDEGEPLELSNREYKLLCLLYKNLGRPFTRDEILNHVWEQGYFGNDRVVDDLVRRLRKKMPRLKMETIYGYGYRLEC